MRGYVSVAAAGQAPGGGAPGSDGLGFPQAVVLNFEEDYSVRESQEGEGEMGDRSEVTVAAPDGVVTAVQGGPSSRCLSCGVRHVTICGVVDDGVLKAVESISRTVGVDQGETLFVEGDPVTAVYNITRGIVRLSKMLPDGRRQITGFLFPGDFVGLGARTSYSYTAEAMTAACLCRFEKPRLDKLMREHREIEDQLLALMEKEVDLAQERMLLLGRKTAAEKVASFLVALSERFDGAETFPVAMTRADIADYLGLTLETVSRTLSAFQRDGLISLERAHMIRLLDRARLEEVTGT